MKRPDHSEIVVITPHSARRDSDLVVRIATAAGLHGATAIWIRQPHWATSEVVSFVRDLRSELKIPIWIGRDIAAACEVNAEALLLPSSAPRGKPSSWNGRIGFSVHHRDEALNRAADGADFVVFGPLYATTKGGVVVRGAGLSVLREVCSITPIPVIAVGGLSVSDLPELVATGASGFAAIRSLSLGS